MCVGFEGFTDYLNFGISNILDGPASSLQQNASPACRGQSRISVWNRKSLHWAQAQYNIHFSNCHFNRPFQDYSIVLFTHQCIVATTVLVPYWNLLNLKKWQNQLGLSHCITSRARKCHSYISCNGFRLS